VFQDASVIQDTLETRKEFASCTKNVKVGLEFRSKFSDLSKFFFSLKFARRTQNSGNVNLVVLRPVHPLPISHANFHANLVALA
jgi:hypothetical protein